MKCDCSIGNCPQEATQEDILCDVCRRGMAEGTHAHVVMDNDIVLPIRYIGPVKVKSPGWTLSRSRRLDDKLFEWEGRIIR